MFLGLHGLSGVGKDTQACLIQQVTGCQHLKMSFGLRAYVYMLLDLDIERAMDKEYEDGEIQSHLITISREMLTNPRYGNMLWVSALLYLVRYKDSVVISDIRQIHEVMFVYLYGGKVIELTRPKPARPEQPLDRLIPHYLIWNTVELRAKDELINIPLMESFDITKIPPHIRLELSKPFNLLVNDLDVKQADKMLIYLQSLYTKLNP